MATTKLIYLAKRNPAIAAEDFPARWKQHAVLAASVSRVNEQFLGVVQCSLLRQAHGLPGLCQDYDGISELWFKCLDDVQALFDPARGLTLLTQVTHAFFVEPQ